MSFFADLGPWLALLVVVALCAAAVVYLRNVKLAVALGAVGAIAVAFLFGRRGGQKDVREDVRRETENAIERNVERAEEARVESDRRNADPDRLRESDGFRRTD